MNFFVLTPRFPCLAFVSYSNTGKQSRKFIVLEAFMKKVLILVVLGVIMTASVFAGHGRGGGHHGYGGGYGHYHGNSWCEIRH